MEGKWESMRAILHSPDSIFHPPVVKIRRRRRRRRREEGREGRG